MSFQADPKKPIGKLYFRLRDSSFAETVYDEHSSINTYLSLLTLYWFQFWADFAKIIELTLLDLKAYRSQTN